MMHNYNIHNSEGGMRDETFHMAKTDAGARIILVMVRIDDRSARQLIFF